MKTVREYLRHAEECEALAHGKMTPWEHEIIRELAETWRMLAEHRRKNLAIREKSGVMLKPPLQRRNVA
jgi:hypothetical protein